MAKPSEEQHASAVVDDSSSGWRADKFVAEVMDLFSRSQFAQHGVTIRVNDSPAKPSRRLRRGERVEVSYHAVEPPSIQPEQMQLEIVYEDDDVVVLDKKQGVVVHPAAGNWSGTLAQGLLHYLRGPVDESEDVRPGIVHRLDKDTSGILIAAKTLPAKEYLAEQFRNRSVEKEYVALVRGTPPRSSGVISDPIKRDPRNRKRFAVAASGGKSARTEYTVLHHFDGYSLLLIHPVTGRTHQIRVHLQSSGCPVLGDPVYSRRDKRFPDATLMLHAYMLSIRLPAGETLQTFTAPLPGRFREVLQALSGLPLEASGFPRQLS